MSTKSKSWIGVDLDGTLAYYNGWKGKSRIGKPITRLVGMIRTAISMGFEVRIFTARAADPDAIIYIRRWLVDAGLPELVITNQKDLGCVEIWDDRAVRIERNHGICEHLPENSVFAKVQARFYQKDLL